MCVTDFDISPNFIYQQQELHVLVTASLCMDLTITYRPKYLSPVSYDINILCCVCFYFVAFDVSLGIHFLLCVCYVNPAYGCQTEINCVYMYTNTNNNNQAVDLVHLCVLHGKAGDRNHRRLHGDQ